MTRPLTLTLLLLLSLTNPVPLRAEEPPSETIQRNVGLQPTIRHDFEHENQVTQFSGEVGTVLIGGWATWYEDPRKTGFYAAAGPLLREALGDWRGRYVTVESGGIEVTVHLTDWCACGERGGIPTLLDLSREAFAGLADPSLGVLRVSIEIDGSPRPDPRDDRMRDEVRDPLPQTDTL